MDMSLSNAKACARLGRKLGNPDSDICKLLRQETAGAVREIQNL